ncbi:MAG: protein-L-isoaspartate(D-aspartate) O-methyltransferase [Bacteroidales bacterium]|nr:protein-L-isoaspartate(D-aspartate) O-methyltransferase [Bacteroidales bacterium]
MMISVLFTECNSQEPADNDFQKRRENMVFTQIKARGVHDKKVLDAMLKVERHRFVPEEYIEEAYEDHPLPVGEGQTISQPYIVAYMTEVLDLDKASRVLEVGTGSGYQAAVLAEICDSVYSIEIFSSLADKAKKTLESLNYTNVFIKTGDGYKGWKEHSPFDAIIVTCAPSHIPDPLQEQLAEGGRMIIPVGEHYSQELVLLEKVNGKLKQKYVLPVRFVPMIDEKGTKY